MLGALVVLWNMGIVSTADALDGFSNTGLMSIGALFIVMQAVDKSRVVDYAARRILGGTDFRQSGVAAHLLPSVLVVWVLQQHALGCPFHADCP